MRLPYIRSFVAMRLQDEDVRYTAERAEVLSDKKEMQDAHPEFGSTETAAIAAADAVNSQSKGIHHTLL